MFWTEIEWIEGGSWCLGRQIRKFFFWMGVLIDLKAHGVQDILITYTDNLNGFTDTIRTVFSQSSVQICVVYQIINSCKYVVYKYMKELTADMKNIHNAPNKEVAAAELDNLEKKWGGKYPYAYFHVGTIGMAYCFLLFPAGNQKNNLYYKSH